MRKDYETCSEAEKLPSCHCTFFLIQLTVPPRFSLGLSNDFVKRSLCTIFKGLTVNHGTHDCVGGTFALCFGGAGFKYGPLRQKNFSDFAQFLQQNCATVLKIR
jgi:hypothetical protein